MAEPARVRMLSNMPTILIVEDNADDAELVERALTKAHIGNRLLIARDGEEALNALYKDAIDKQFGIGIVLLDLTLPKLDGRVLLERIWDDRRLRQIPVFVLTGSTEDDDLVKTYKTGAVAFLRKPLEVDRFLSTMSDLTNYRICITLEPNAL